MNRKHFVHYLSARSLASPFFPLLERYFSAKSCDVKERFPSLKPSQHNGAESHSSSREAGRNPNIYLSLWGIERVGRGRGERINLVDATINISNKESSSPMSRLELELERTVDRSFPLRTCRLSLLLRNCNGEMREEKFPAIFSTFARLLPAQPNSFFSGSACQGWTQTQRAYLIVWINKSYKTTRTSVWILIMIKRPRLRLENGGKKRAEHGEIGEV